MNTRILFVLHIFFFSFAHAQTSILSIIPNPQNWEIQAGTFQINSQTVLYLNPRDSVAKKEAKPLIEQIFLVSGILLKTISQIPLSKQNFIMLNSESVNSHGKEAYQLNISANKVEILASDGAGLFYGIKSLEQLFPYKGLLNLLVSQGSSPISSKTPRSIQPIILPCLRIDDYPKYAWRGMHLDVSRHFFSIEFIKRYLDYLSWCKMNVFHWHLTDSQGWRLEIKKYPKLTAIGAYRVQRPKELFSEALPMQTGEIANYGGYYTQDEVRDIIGYATKLHITVVPEIDMPGHSQAALVAYPEYSSLPGQVAMPSGSKGAYDNSFNPGNDSTYIFLENILQEVMNLFPSQYIHVGGDEVDRKIWKSNRSCTELVKREHLRSEGELQAYFTKRIEKFIASKGRKMIGWDEILVGGIDSSAAIMSWRGNKGGIRAIMEHHQVVMSPKNYTYFDLYQGDPKLEPDSYSNLDLTTVYQFYPTPTDMTSEQKRYILGGEGALWTETVEDSQQAEYMLFPRLLALSEALWLLPQHKNWEAFKAKLPFYFSILETAKINFARSAYNVRDIPIRDSALYRVKLKCGNELGEGKIYYTLDGESPSLSSTQYQAPFLVEGSKTLKLATFLDGVQISKINEERFETSLSTSKEVIMTPLPSKRFPGLSTFVLTDGIRGTDNPLDGRWVGFTGSTWRAVLDLGSPLIIKNIGIDFLVNPSIGVYLPKGLKIERSLDGKNYNILTSYSENELNALKMAKRIKVYREFSPESARYIRLTADIPPPGIYDRGHAYILTDEIIVH